jgi:hypothetical protein
MSVGGRSRVTEGERGGLVNPRGSPGVPGVFLVSGFLGLWFFFWSLVFWVSGVPGGPRGLWGGLIFWGLEFFFKGGLTF